MRPVYYGSGVLELETFQVISIDALSVMTLKRTNRAYISKGAVLKDIWKEFRRFKRKGSGVRTDKR